MARKREKEKGWKAGNTVKLITSAAAHALATNSLAVLGAGGVPQGHPLAEAWLGRDME